MGQTLPRGPWRSLGSPGVQAAADRFGLDWGSAGAAVRAVAAEACARVPEEWEIEGPGISLSLGNAADVDPELLEAMLGPDGLGGEALGPQWGQDAAADALRPGPVLAALTEQAVADAAYLTDDELTGALQAARRQQNRAAWQETMLVAEFARRRAAQEADAKARGIPKGRRPGEFAGDELAAELLITASRAAGRIEADLELTGRLPKTLAGMAAGIISADRADAVAACTACLSDADAALADEILAAAAPGLRVDQLARKAAALEMKLDPEAARARREHARDTRRRVEVRRELSGNASLAGRELDTADALAAKAYIDALAVKLRNYGCVEGTLSSIRARVMTELLQGRDPLDLLTPNLIPAPRPAADDPSRPVGPVGDGGGGRPGGPGLVARPGGSDTADYPCCPGDPDDPGPDDRDAPASLAYGPAGPTPGGPFDPDDWDSPAGPGYAGPGGRPSWDPGEEQGARYFDLEDEHTRRGPLRPTDLAPLPAAINLLVPVGALLGWPNAAPAHANGIGLLDTPETQAIIAAASRHPRTRWCATIINPDGTATAHACAPGQHPWTPAEPPPPETPESLPWERLRELLAQLRLAPDRITSGDCDHRRAEDRYTPSRKLKHLLRARTQTCDAPGCNAQALYCDLDHTQPYPDGPTCQCNLGPKCRRHHRAKQAPGWHVEQPGPGLVRWTLPNGRTHTTTPTVYDT